MAKYCVIIAAAGKSERFGKESKTMVKLDGRPVFLRSIELFTRRDEVIEILLAVAPSDHETIKTKFGANLGFMGVKLIEGGDQRWETVANALEKVTDEADYVAVHDAARPCTSAAQIDAVLTEAVKSGAAILAAPIVGTIKRVSDQRIVDQTIDRASLFEAQTPQVFRKNVLISAYAAVSTDSAAPTDDAQIVEQSGHPVSIVPSDASNLKITTKGDLTLATAILKSRPQRKVQKFGAFEEAQW